MRHLALLGALLFATDLAAAAPKTRSTTKTSPRRDASHDGAHARVAFGQSGVLRAPRDENGVRGRRAEPLTPEEDTARKIEQVLRGPLRVGVTGLYVADARSGEVLFAVNADDPLNPASNVKMISTATSLELLGASFRYTTRVLGGAPDAGGAIRGNVYLLGTWDPTLALTDFDELAQQLADHGVKELDGDVIVGSDPTRDGLYRALVPIVVTAGEPGAAPTVAAPAGFDLVVPAVTAKTTKAAGKPRLVFTSKATTDGTGHARVELAVAGTIGKGGATTYMLRVDDRTAAAAHALRSAMRAHGIAVFGDVRTGELPAFVGDPARGALPIELARHRSATLAEIVAHVNKWSINWLADRVVMTTAALARRTAPTMDVALDAMYGWLGRHTHAGKDDVLVDTGSGLSYKTRITAHELVAVVRSAAGFDGGDPALARAWLDSLAVGGRDGTLGRRFTAADVRGHLRGKTGTLSTVIALSGVLDVDPARPLVFALVTNGDQPLAQAYVRKAHEQVVALLCSYLTKTAKAAPPAVAPPPVVRPPEPDDLDEAVADPELDRETAKQR
jgi:D-alanyl-D-alanine carboxypeptidase/D-alanyl-D-alanine-endopeptidase (penicillin-binding protein 4)